MNFLPIIFVFFAPIALFILQLLLCLRCKRWILKLLPTILTIISQPFCFFVFAGTIGNNELTDITLWLFVGAVLCLALVAVAWFAYAVILVVSNIVKLVRLYKLEKNKLGPAGSDE